VGHVITMNATVEGELLRHVAKCMRINADIPEASFEARLTQKDGEHGDIAPRVVWLQPTIK